MPHHLLVYDVTAGVNDVNVDMQAAVDPSFSRRGGTGVDHYLLTEPYNMIQAYHLGANALRLRFNNPTMNSFGFRHTLRDVERSATVPANPNVIDYRDMPFALPMNEEIALEESGNLGAATEKEHAVLWIAPPSWNRNLRRNYLYHGTARFTATYTLAANAWSADAAITFTEALLGGVYVIVGAWVQATGAIAFRFNLPRMALYNGRKLFPGDLAYNAVANIDQRGSWNKWGEWGLFHSFEPPLISVFANTGAGTTLEGRMDLLYLGKTAPGFETI